MAICVDELVSRIEEQGARKAKEEQEKQQRIEENFKKTIVAYHEKLRIKVSQIHNVYKDDMEALISVFNSLKKTKCFIKARLLVHTILCQIHIHFFDKLDLWNIKKNIVIRHR